MVILYSMKRPIFVRPLSDAERRTLEAGLRSPDAFTLRRCQILLASNRGKNAYQTAHQLGCNPQNGTQRYLCLQPEGAPAGTSAGFEASAHRSQGLRCWAGRGFAGVASPRSTQVRQR